MPPQHHGSPLLPVMYFEVQYSLEHQLGMATANTPIVLSNFHFGIITSCSLLYL